MAWDGVGSGTNTPDTNQNNITGVIDEDGYDFVDGDLYPNVDNNNQDDSDQDSDTDDDGDNE